MTYLERLRAREIFSQLGAEAPSEPSKVPSDGFDSTLGGASKNMRIDSGTESRSEAISWGWRVTHPDGRAHEIYYLPEGTRREVEREYPGAIVEPIPEPRHAPFAEYGELRPCSVCRNLTERGACLAAWRGELLNVGKQYRPEQQQPRRCEGYLPRFSDSDQRRSGNERWPNLRKLRSNHEDDQINRQTQWACQARNDETNAKQARGENSVRYR